MSSPTEHRASSWFAIEVCDLRTTAVAAIVPRQAHHNHIVSTAGLRGLNLKSHRIRLSIALPTALAVAALVQLIQFHLTWPDLAGERVLDQLWRTLVQTVAIGLPLAIAAVAVTEYLRVRQLNVQLALGTAVTFIGAHLATRNEPLTSYVFSGGPLATMGLIATGVAASVIYWAIAGRRAGWRGDTSENEHALATEIYRRASSAARVGRCSKCVAVWGGVSAAAFALFAWLAIDGSGLRRELHATAEREGQSALANSGYGWAEFQILAGRGAIVGTAPDEFEKRIAYETARETLAAVTGVPGVLTRIDDKAVAEVAMAAVNQKLADAKRREQQANEAIEEAKRLAHAARTMDAQRLADDQSATTQPEPPQMSAVPSSDPESARAVAQRQAAEALASPFLDAPAEAEQPEQVVAALSGEAPSADQVGARPPAPSGEADSCTDQDIALVETSHVVFQPQTFDITPAFQRSMDRVAASVRACGRRSIMITGYSDANADTLFNPALGLQRAAAVRDGLIARGVGETQIAIKSPPFGFFGYTGSAELRDTFRRTEIKFIEGAELSRDATQRPDERASNCEADLAEIMSQSIIHFPNASARISAESLGLIAKLAGAIQNCGSVIVTVEGHTDKIGTPERNQQLSIVRANAVRDALVNVGADPTRLASRGFASTRPFALEESAEAYALNRRIEFKVSGKFTSTKAGGP